MEKIRVRTDDVLWPGKSKYRGPRAFGRFRGHHNWIVDASEHFYHTPALLCRDLENYDGAIEYIRKETEEGRMLPILHGWEHLNYMRVDDQTLWDHTEMAVDWFLRKLGRQPTIWATPSGDISEAMVAVCSDYDMILETTRSPVIDQKDAHWLTKYCESIQPLDGLVVMVHWWELGTRLARICYTGKYGTWQEAKKQKPEFF